MRWAIIACTLLATPALAIQPDFTVELYAPRDGLRQCQVGFNTGLPPKPKVDSLMEKALALCSSVDPKHDVQVMAFSGNDPLDDKHETYTYLVHYRSDGRIERVTFEQSIKSLHLGPPKH